MFSNSSENESDNESEVILPFRKRRRVNVIDTSESDEIDETEVPTTSRNIIWTSNNFIPKIHKFTALHPGINANVNRSSTFIDYFQLFFSEELVEYITSKTNSYRLDKNNNSTDSTVRQETTVNELYRFFGLTMLMTRIKKLSLYEYWSKDKLLRSDIFGEVMSRNRYFYILQMLHFNDDVQNNYDRLRKIRPIVDMLRKSFNESFQPFQKLCIDESLLLYKGRLSFKQYIPSKRNRFGVKSFVLCDCKTGYIQDLIIYTGASATVDMKYKDIGKSGEVVLSLLNPHLGKGHTVFVDNWYSSPALFNFLHKNATNACGTARKRRKGMPRIEGRLKKGESSFRSCDNLLAIKWADKKEVYMLSTMHKPEFAEVAKRHGKREKVRKPVCVIDYNSSMGTVDKTDMVISTVQSPRKSLKWYREYFFHLLDICLWNAYCLYKCKTKKTISLAHFQFHLIKQIFKKYSNNQQLHNNKTGNNNPARLTQRHFPSTYTPSGKNKYRRCVVCSKNDRRQDTKCQCEDCDVGLCLSPCFKIYHTQLYY